MGTSEDHAYAVAVQPDGKIVVAGYVNSFNEYANWDFAVARLNSDGSLDATFGTGGSATFDFGSSEDYCYSVALQGTKIILAGRSTQPNLGYAFFAARVNGDGMLDATFGDGGKQTFAFNNSFESYGNCVAVQGDNKVVLGGFTYGGDDSIWDFAVARLDADGHLDTSFNGTGK